MLQKCLAFCLLFLGISSSAYSQFYPTQYRPPHQQWKFVKTPHFNIVYGGNNDSTAFQMGGLLEEHYHKVQDLVGGSLTNFPVILNAYNDRSNGFVTPFHFRSEIELPPIKGKALNPQTGNWLENVGPHELVHALQFNNLGSYNIPKFVSLFSPDLARSFHAAIPFGMLEGIAVHHETKNVSPHGGRGNFPVFTNQFNSTFKSDQRWSMGQLFQISSNSRPFNRHYIGGYQFTAWLQHTFGPEVTRKALDFYMDFPFLGYGLALRHSTGLWPGQLYKRFEEATKDSLSNYNEQHDEKPLNIPFDGREVRQPKWLSDSKLLFYGSFYNARSGFYSYDLKTNNIQRILTSNSVRGYQYDLSADKSSMVYSYYDTDALYDNTAKAELVEYNFHLNKAVQLTKGGRLYAPIFSGDSLLVLQTKAASSQLVSFTKNNNSSGKIEPLLSLGEHEIIDLAQNPVNDKLAIIVNKRGMQALWIVAPGHMQRDLQQAPDIAFSQGAIYDPQWHPGGEKLLFSSDFSGTHQIYEYSLDEQAVSKITNSTFNAFEGSYSPDGNRIAYIKQIKNERLPVVSSISKLHYSTIAKSKWQPSQSKLSFMNRPVVADATIKRSKNWETGEFSEGLTWLKPRTVLPIFEEVSNRNKYQMGIGVHSNNLLASQSYSGDFSYLEERIWYDISYRNKTFFPGFKSRLFSDPSYLTIPDVGTLLRQERSLALSIPTRFRLRQNIFNTTFFIEPEVRQSQIKYFELNPGNNSSDFANFTIGNLYTQFNYRLQQNIRDLQPNSGFVLFSEVEHYFNSGDLSLSAYGNNISLNGRNATALRAGILGFFSPLRRWNQSLRIGIEGLTQSGFLFDNQSLVSNGFSEPVFTGSNNLLSFDTRYTIPLMYVDDGGLLLPFYLSNIYLVAFSNTITDPNFDNWYKNSRSVFGVGIRAQFRLSNLSFNIGIGYGYEPTRRNSQFFIGQF